MREYRSAQDKKGETATVDTNKAYRWSTDTTTIILNLEIDGSSKLHAPAALPPEQTPAPIEQEAVWTPEWIWTVWNIKHLALAAIRTRNRPSRTAIRQSTLTEV